MQNIKNKTFGDQHRAFYKLDALPAIQPKENLFQHMDTINAINHMQQRL